MNPKLAYIATALLIFCSSASAGMNCQDPPALGSVEYPRRLLSTNAMQYLFPYAAVAADARNGNSILLEKIVNSLKNPQVQSISDAFDIDPALNILVNHAAIQPGIKASTAPCAPSEWTTYGPTLFYHLSVKAKGDQSTDGRVYGAQVVYQYRSFVTAFNSAVKNATVDRRKIMEACLINSGWNQFIHSDLVGPVNALLKAIKSKNQASISAQKSSFKVKALSVDQSAALAAACVVQ